MIAPTDAGEAAGRSVPMASPRPCAPEGRAPDAPPRPRAHARARLLLLEPDADVAALVAAILADEGYAVDHVAEPDALGAYLARRGPTACDLVLSAPYADPLRAPYAWLDTLRARVRAPIAICARYPAALYADHRARGYAAYLEEPFALDDLVTLVARLCATAADHRCGGSVREYGIPAPTPSWSRATRGRWPRRPLSRAGHQQTCTQRQEA